jgi:phage/plasmid-like protein (TIGR03299 family)
MRIGKDDLVNKNLLFTTAHDGSKGAMTQIMPLRNICTNTLTMAMRQAKMSFRHSANIEEKVRNANQIMGISHKLFDELEVIFNVMHQKPFLSADLKEYVQTLVPDNVAAENNARTENMRNQMYQLAETGRGHEMARGTAWGAYNAVTEFVDHYQNVNAKGDKSLKSQWFGAGSKLKEKAFELAKKMCN